MQKYFNDWINPKLFKINPHILVVGMEIRIKRTNLISTKLKRDAEKIKKITGLHGKRLMVGTFSETPTSCQGYWTKSAAERYVNFAMDNRNNFDFLFNLGYDYIITDMPNVLYNLRSVRSK